MRSWADHDLQSLQELYGNTEIHIDDIVNTIGKSRAAIHLKANRMGLSRPLKEAMQNPEIRQKIATNAKLRTGERNPFYGKKHKLETIEAMKLKLGKMMSGDRNPFFGKHHSETTRSKLSLVKRRTVCGSLNPAWKGGYEPYYGPNWHEQRRKALKRDNYTCQKCFGKRGGRLEVHHIIPFRLFKSYREANRLRNLITFCIRCHRKAEWEVN